MVYDEDGVVVFVVGEVVVVVCVVVYYWFVRCLRGYRRGICIGLLMGLCCIFV